MEGLVGPLLIAAALVVVAGAPKILDPGDTTRAIKSVGIPASDPLVRLFAVAEVAVGAAVIVGGGRIAAMALGVLYLGFAGFVGLALAKGGSVASCGCFGTPDTPPTVAHLLLDGAAAAVAFAAVVWPQPGIVDTLAAQPAAGVPFVGFVAIGTWLGYLALTAVPRLVASRTAS